MIRRAFLVCALALLAASPSAAAKLKVVATFSILGEMTGRVAGDRVEIKTLVGPDADAHVFEPTPADARAVSEAQIVLMSGLGFEPWADRLLKSTQSRARKVFASQGVKPLWLSKFNGGAPDPSQEVPDPHAWQDARNAIVYAQNIARALAAADAPNAKVYEANAAAYTAELTKLDADIRAGLAKVPPERRRVITTHDAFAYFGKAYGITFIAPLGTSTEEQPSAKKVAALIAQIRREKITAVFVENISDPRLIQQIARETGVTLGGKLYSDALSTEAGEAPTYIALMRHNAKLLTDAMAKGS